MSKAQSIREPPEETQERNQTGTDLSCVICALFVISRFRLESPPFLKFISKEHHSISSLSCKHMQSNYGASQLFQHAPYILGGQGGKDLSKETSQGQQSGCLLRGHYEL